MPAPLSTTGASSELHTWQELEEVFAALGQLARSSPAPTEFYRTLLDQSVRALSAIGGAVWLRGPGGVFQPVVQIGWPRDEVGGDPTTRREHESLLAEAAASRQVLSIAPRAIANEGAANPTNHVLLLTPVHAASGASPEAPADTRAIIELLLRADASPAAHRGCEKFLTAVSELAADFHAFHDLSTLRASDVYRSQLLNFSRDTHRRLELPDTAFTVANEGRDLIGCDRLSVLMAHGSRCRLLATSGASHIERRSTAARHLARVADLVRRTDEPAFYADGHSDGLPPLAEALEQHADESHARQIAVVPVRQLARSLRSVDDGASDRGHARPELRPRFVLIAEQFDAQSFDRERLVEVADLCSTALYNASDLAQLPLGWLTRPLAALKRQVTSHLPRTLFVAIAIAGAIAALVLVPANFNVETGGTLQPTVKRDLFAPRSGIVEEVLVAHGAHVEQGKPLVQLRDPALDLEIKRVDGDLETAQRQLDAVRATRTNRAVRDAQPTEAYRLSAEERELQQRLTNLRRELDLLQSERQKLVVTAPISGNVLTWDVSHRLAGRPVERGEVLMTVADFSQPWQLELDVPDDRIGYVLAAQQTLQTDLPVRFRLGSDEHQQHEGRISEICQTAIVGDPAAPASMPTVLVKVALDASSLSDSQRHELRPGMSARAQIACGRAPIGYVWLHDIWDALLEWLTY